VPRSSRTSPRPATPRRRIRKLRLLGLLVVVVFLTTSAFSFGFVTAVAGELPKLDPRNQQQVQVNGHVYDSTGNTILAVLRGEESRVLVEPSEIAPVMKQAVVAVEDKRFFTHRGVDVRALARALWEDVNQKRVVQGGSTITQQYVKNVFRDDERTIARKVREAALAWQLEQEWDKERILAAYLNTIYFGNGAYGVQQAGKIYFGKGASRLSLHEAALLAAIPADPTRYDPVLHPREARARRALVLRAMLAQGDITRAQLGAANAAPLPDADDIRLPGIQGPAPYFTNYVKQQLVETYGERRIFGGGLRITTSIDLQLQKVARDAVGEWLDDPVGPSAALVAIDPRDGRVLAMVGGRNFRENQFNLAVQARRQPGSAFKPFVLAAALEQGISPATRFVSDKVSIPLGDRYWVVENYDDLYLGSVDLATATTHSDNAVYAQLTRLVGPAAVKRVAARLGVTAPLRSYYSIGLGAQAVSPLELARAYSAFANGGYRFDTGRFGNRPRTVVSIEDREGRPVDQRELMPRAAAKLRPQTAAWVNAVLQDVVERGTGTLAAIPGRPVAGKTGTTENYGDAWFVGYTPQLVVAVWVGYRKELRPMLTEYEGEPVTGGTLPALIWKSFVERAHAGYAPEVEQFEPPSLAGYAAKLVVNRGGRIQLDNGNCDAAVEVVYFPGFGPKESADCAAD
jgi:penicillin-binding protein 1A